MNKVILIGRICRDVELRQTTSGLETCSFAVAINNGKDKEGNEREADFISCRAWRNTAKFISEWFSKGSMIAIEGKFKTDRYQDKNYPDITHYSSYVLVEKAEFCGGRSENTGSHQTQAPAPQTTTAPAPTPAELGDLGDFEEILSDGEVPF